MSDGPLLSLEGASVVVDGALALSRLTLAARGPRVVIAGSHAPLSLLLACGVLEDGTVADVELSEGKVELARCDVGTRAHLGVTGVVLRDAVAPPRASALEWLEWHARLKGMSSRAARHASHAALESLGLGSLARHAFAHLGALERRLVGIAKATIGEPRVLVFLDPLGGLEPPALDAVAGAVATACRDTESLFFVPALASFGPALELARSASTLVILRDGQVAFEGEPSAVFGAARAYAVTVSRNGAALMQELGALGARVEGGPNHACVWLPPELALADLLGVSARARAPITSCAPLV